MSRAKEELTVLSFRIDVLKKYINNTQNYECNLDENVGILRSLGKKENWSLQIDVHTNDENGSYMNALFYQLETLPDDEKEHFKKYIINRQELSKTARRRWIEGLP